MDNLNNKVAFITGGASGIGLGIAKACGRWGMKVIIVDARQKAIDEALPFFKEKGWPAYGIKLDVTDREAYAKAGDEAEAVFGKIHVLVNNAGVDAGTGPLWKYSYKACDFGVGINIIGVLNGIINIVPRILKHGESGHVVSTASQAGLIVVPGCGIYNMTKHAVIGMMETLASDLVGTNVGASAFIPGPVTSNLGISSKEVRPESLREEKPDIPPSPKAIEGEKTPHMPDFSKMFMTPEEVGERVLRGIRRKDLYILTHPEFKEGVRARGEAVLRAYPNEPLNEELMKTFGMLVYNPIYDTQTTPGDPDWK